MRNFVISDIHGNNEAFRRALKFVRLKKSDKLILLGDLIDRGQDSKGVLDTIFLLKENGFNVECIMGNHEEMLIDSFNDKQIYNNWLKNGGDETLYSFLTSSIEKIPIKYINFLKSFKYSYQLDRFIFVHAALNMKIDNPFSDVKTLLWERDSYKFFDENWLQNRIVIHGHNPVTKNTILTSLNKKDKIINIDNGSFLNREGYGSICILELETLNINFVK